MKVKVISQGKRTIILPSDFDEKKLSAKKHGIDPFKKYKVSNHPLTKKGVLVEDNKDVTV